MTQSILICIGICIACAAFGSLWVRRPYSGDLHLPDDAFTREAMLARGVRGPAVAKRVQPSWSLLRGDAKPASTIGLR